MPRYVPVQIEEPTIMTALQKAQGNLRKASEMLGVSTAWLSYWLKREGYVQVITWEKK